MSERSRPLVASSIIVSLGLLASACSSDTSNTAETTTTQPPSTTTAPPSTAAEVETTDATEPTPSGATRDDLAAVEHGVGDALYPGAGAEGLDVAHYDLVIDTTNNSFRAVAAIDLTIEDPQQEILSFDLVGLTATDVQLNGEPAEFGQSEIELNIAHDGSSAATVVISYEGSPRAHDVGLGLGLGLGNIGWHSKPWGSFVAAEPTGAPTWFPVNDHPTDKATFTLTITVDDDKIAVGPGPGRQSTDNAYTFSPADEMAPYLMSVVVGDFDVVDTTGASGVPVKAATHSSVQPHNPDIESMIVELEALFGDYPFDSYGYVVVPEQLGFALENQTLSLFDLSTYNNDQIHAHELAHQWFGDYISPTEWTDIWLNEGFATWVDTWWASDGDPAAFDGLAADVPDFFKGPLLIEHPSSLFSTTVYVRGALLLEALRRTIGHEEFQALLREWLRRYGGGTASTADFIGLVSDLHGADAEALVTEWVEADVVPELPPA